MVREASFYDKLDNGAVRCGLCRHHCVIADSQSGICGVRLNRNGTLHTLVYNRPCSYHVDPIEKKPLFHFFPGSRAFSIATVGCNFRCRHCQNHEISQMPRDEGTIAGQTMTPEEVVEHALSAGCRSISYTYTEPTIFFEYALDIARLAKEKGLYNNFVTNGYTEEEPLRAIQPYLDGANIDLKAFSEEFYRDVCSARLSGVLDTIRCYRRLGIWIELTTLVIPGYNDREEEFTAIARFIRDELGPEVPWHVSAFYPTYRLLDAPPTGAAVIERARAIGLSQGLRHVYSGNIRGMKGEHTYCHNCGSTIIERHGYSLASYRITKGACASCGARVAGIGM